MTDATGADYAGHADHGLESSLPATAPQLGDIVEIVTAEHDKLERLLSLMVSLAEEGDHGDLARRWFGVVRETLEFEAAQERVVWAAVGDDGELGVQHERQRQLVELLSTQDALLDQELDVDEVTRIAQSAREHLATGLEVLLPVLERLPADERRELGEDLRQVMG